MFFRIITGVLVVSLIGMICVANSGNGHFLLSILHKVPHGDKWMHLLLIGSIAAFLNLSLNFKMWTVRGNSILAGTLIVASIITVEEFSQGFLPTRNFEILDLVCNYLGAFGIGSVPYFLSRKFSIDLTQFLK